MPENESLSVVIPAYNESKRILPTLKRMSEYLMAGNCEFEIIVVDDGSSDGTPNVVEGSGLSGVRLIRSASNAGKGAALKKGVMDAKMSLILISDADMSTPIEEVEKLLRFVREGYDIAIGSRALPGADIAVRQPWYREYMGKGFNLIVRTLLMGGIRDTQCGFKLYKANAAKKIFALSRLKGYSFDPEVLFIARNAGYSIKEVPVKWLNSPESKVRLLRDPADMFLGILRIRLNRILGRYGRLAS